MHTRRAMICVALAAVVAPFVLTGEAQAESRYPKNVVPLQKWAMCSNPKVAMLVYFEAGTYKDSRFSKREYRGVNVKEIQVKYLKKGDRVKGPDAPMKPLNFSVYWDSPKLPARVKNRRDLYGSIGGRDEWKS